MVRATSRPPHHRSDGWAPATVVGRALRTGPDTGPQLALELPAAAARGVIETVWWLDRAAARVVSPSLAREEVPDLSLQD